jgi:hypothetical protein
MSTGPRITKNQMEIRQAIGKIKIAFIFAFISAGFTALAIFLSTSRTAVVNSVGLYGLYDVGVIAVMAVLIMTIKSRIASVALLGHYLFSQFMLRFLNPEIGLISTSTFSSFCFSISILCVALLFVLAYVYGIIGTFSYHKLKKSAKQGGMAGQTNTNVSIVPSAAIRQPSPAIRQASPKGKILLSQMYDNQAIVVKRASSVTELIVNNMVYAEKKGVFEASYTLEAVVGNVSIEVTSYTSMFKSFICLYINGYLVEQKKRIV